MGLAPGLLGELDGLGLAACGGGGSGGWHSGTNLALPQGPNIWRNGGACRELGGLPLVLAGGLGLGRSLVLGGWRSGLALPLVAGLFLVAGRLLLGRGNDSGKPER